MSNHPAIADLYRIMPTWKHEELDTWVKHWTDTAYARSTSLHAIDHAAIIKGEQTRTKHAVATIAAEKACITAVDYADKSPSRDVIVTSRATFLLPERK